MLSVTMLTAVALAPLLFKNEDLFRPGLAQNFAQHFGIGNLRYSNLDIVVAANKQHILEGNLFSHLAGELLNLDDISFADAVLLTACSNHSIHHKFFPE